jgi:hypothetical protein
LKYLTAATPAATVWIIAIAKYKMRRRGTFAKQATNIPYTGKGPNQHGTDGPVSEGPEPYNTPKGKKRMVSQVNTG